MVDIYSYIIRLANQLITARGTILYSHGGGGRIGDVIVYSTTLLVCWGYKPDYASKNPQLLTLSCLGRHRLLLWGTGRPRLIWCEMMHIIFRMPSLAALPGLQMNLLVLFESNVLADVFIQAANQGPSDDGICLRVPSPALQNPKIVPL